MATTITLQDIEATVFSNLAKFGADSGRLSRDATLDSLDVDSLDLVELTQVIEETFGVDLEGADFKSVETVGDVIDLVAGRVQE